MKIDFDIKYRPEIESGKYIVQTREGANVRILCWDKKNNTYPIVALVTTLQDPSIEHTTTYTKDGHLVVNTVNEGDLVLITDTFDPNTEFTPFEYEVYKALGFSNEDESTISKVKNIATKLHKEMRSKAADGLHVAINSFDIQGIRKDILLFVADMLTSEGMLDDLLERADSLKNRIIKAANMRDVDSAYKKGYNDGYDKFKSEMPKWHKMPTTTLEFRIVGIVGDTLFHNEKYIRLEDLERLPVDNKEK